MLGVPRLGEARTRHPEQSAMRSDAFTHHGRAGRHHHHRYRGFAPGYGWSGGYGAPRYSDPFDFGAFGGDEFDPWQNQHASDARCTPDHFDRSCTSLDRR